MAGHKNQIDIQWAEPEPFALVIQNTQDGGRITSAARQKEADQHQSDQQQEKFNVQ